MASSNVPNSKSPVRDRTFATVDDCIQGGPYVPVLQKVVIVRLVLKISIIDTNIIQKSYKNTFFLKVTRV